MPYTSASYRAHVRELGGEKCHDGLSPLRQERDLEKDYAE